MSQAPPSTISDSDWYKKQGGKLTLLDYSADLFKVRLLPPHCPRRPPDHRLCFTASLVVQVGTEIVHFFIDIDEETGKQKSIYAIGYISKIPTRGKYRGSRWVTYSDGEYPHDLLEEHHGRVWSFMESNRDYEYGAPEPPAPASIAGGVTEDHAPVSSVGAQPVIRDRHLIASDSDDDDVPLSERLKVRRVTC